MRRQMGWCFVMIALLGTLPGYAQTTESAEAELKRQTRALEKTALKLDSEQRLQALSEQLGVPVEIIRQQQQKTGLGAGQIFIANALAQSVKSQGSSKDFYALVGEFQAGKGWGKIAQENGLKLGQVVSMMKRSNTAIERKLRNEARAEKSGGQGKSAKSDRPRRDAGAHGGQGRKQR